MTHTETTAPATTTYVTDEWTGDLLGTMPGTAAYGDRFDDTHVVVQVCHPTTYVRTAVARRISPAAR